LFFVNYLPASLHHCVALLLGGCVSARIATSGTAAIPGRATVSSFGCLGRQQSQDHCN
jgi:hypothetical protein